MRSDHEQKVWDSFAAAALQGLLAADGNLNYDDAAIDAARHANAMMLERAADREFPR